MRIPLLALAGALAAGGAACARPEAPEATPDGQPFQVPAALAGHLVAMNGIPTFLPCGEGTDPVAITDSPDSQAAGALAALGGGDQPIPVLLRLRGDTLMEVRHAAPEGGGGEGGCARLPEPGNVNARGNEPFWHLRVEGDTATLTRPEIPAGIRRGGGSWSRPDSLSWRYEGDDGAVVLELVAARCHDGMSGAWYPFRATLRWGPERLDGCALEGTAAIGHGSQ